MGTSLSSFPIGDRKFLTIGHMLYLPGSAPRFRPGWCCRPTCRTATKVRIVSGLQFSGSFDESKWFK